MTNRHVYSGATASLKNNTFFPLKGYRKYIYDRTKNCQHHNLSGRKNISKFTNFPTTLQACF